MVADIQCDLYSYSEDSSSDSSPYIIVSESSVLCTSRSLVQNLTQSSRWSHELVADADMATPASRGMGRSRIFPARMPTDRALDCGSDQHQSNNVSLSLLLVTWFGVNLESIPIGVSYSLSSRLASDSSTT